jgi:lipopolysaccharide/colanic/teichoic acid biosynthesis glycosyltransferase
MFCEEVMPSEWREESQARSVVLQENAGSTASISSYSAYRSYRRFFKRWFDIGLTIAFLPLILPVAFVVGFLVRLDSPGVVLVKLKRLGKDGCAFYKYKFRTMVPDADRVLQNLLQSNEDLREEYFSTYKIKNDPRITRVGRWLRRTSLDELAQVINVLRGEMSWVGPRDILDTELKMYGDSAAKFVTVKPGITGLWQVSGRSRLPYSERVRLDMYYIDNVSLLLDLRILLKTIPVLLFGDGAV